MSELKIKGTVIEILKAESGISKAGKEWNKQDFVIRTEDQYPKPVCFTLFGDKTSLLNGINTGENVDVYFNLESREYNGRWFHNVNAWKIIADEQQNEMPPAPLEPPINDAPPPESQDLPF